MATTGKWKAGTNPPGTPLTVFTGAAINSLANNTATAASTAIANQTNLDLYADIWLHLGSLTPTAGGYVTIYILEAIDSSTYPSATASILRNQPSHVLVTMSLDTAVGAQDVVVRNVLLPPASFKLVLDNQSGVSLNAAGNTLTLITYNLDLNG